MRLNPEAHNLLATALDTLRGELLPALPDEKRYAALMTANALAMVEREMHAADSAGEAFLTAAGALYGPPGEAAADALAQRLCADIEAGRFDADSPERQAALECLKASIAARLAITNPKLLASAEGFQA